MLGSSIGGFLQSRNTFLCSQFQGQFVSYSGDDLWGSSYAAAAAAAAAQAAVTTAGGGPAPPAPNPAQPNIPVPVTHNNNAYYLPVRIIRLFFRNGHW